MADSKKYDGSQWEHSLRKLTTATEAVENPLYSDGTAITSYTIKGNTVQNGTPSPQNPVMPQGVGNKTANLFNEVYPSIISSAQYIALNVGDGDYTLSTTTPQAQSAALLFLLAGDVSSGVSTAINGVWNGQTRTVTAVDGYVTIAYRAYPEASPVDYKTILNKGSTALDYEPYGYKIPISSGGVTNNIYLGSVQTARAIKKLVLTGEETVAGSAVTGGWIITNLSDSINNTAGVQTAYCSHYEAKENGAMSGLSNGEMCISTQYNNRINFVTSFSSATDFQAYLAQQYANGTPVTVWYILATPTTGIANEPLMKIGNYADSISNAVSIPTADGTNSITVDTTVQPSEFTATWTGWHDASVKEWDGSEWQ